MYVDGVNTTVEVSEFHGGTATRCVPAHENLWNADCVGNGHEEPKLPDGKPNKNAPA